MARPLLGVLYPVKPWSQPLLTRSIEVCGSSPWLDTAHIFTDSRAFVQPNDFVPERWTSQPDLILRRDAFVPFSYGTYNCAGKPLAMMQLRMVIAMVVKKYELSFAPSKEEECERYIHDQADCFTLHLHPLPLMLNERSSQK